MKMLSEIDTRNSKENIKFNIFPINVDHLLTLLAWMFIFMIFTQIAITIRHIRDKHERTRIVRPSSSGSRESASFTSTCLSFSRLSRNDKNFRKIFSSRMSIMLSRHSVAAARILALRNSHVYANGFPHTWDLRESTLNPINIPLGRK
jgi:hypothetical protein